MIDWNNLVEVKAFALRLGPGMVVFRDRTRRNYNICHAVNFDTKDLYKNCIEIYRT